MMPRPRRLTSALLLSPAGASLLALGAVVFASADALAVEPELTEDSAFQQYAVSNPTGQTVLDRTRFTTSLGVNMYDLLNEDSVSRDGPELNFRARVRYDTDFGVAGAETSTAQANWSTLVPGLTDDTGLVDVMYAYVEGRRFLHGILGFKVGRQYMVDSLGWWSFDGAEVRATLPFYMAVEAYGGLEQRGGLPLSTARFEAGGVWRGDRSGYDPSLYPQFQPADIAPAFGAAVESAGVTWLHSRLTYRRVYDTGSVGLLEFPNANLPPSQYGTYDGTRVSSDRIGYSIEADLKKWGGIKGGLAYDLYDVKFSQIYASLDVFATKHLTASLDYDYFAPSYDADSIWNIFASEPINDVSVRAAYSQNRWSASAGVQARVYTVDTDNPNPTSASPNLQQSTGGPYAGYYPTNGHPFDEGANLAARYKWGSGSAGLRAAMDLGDAGDRVGADLNANQVLQSRYLLKARVGVWNWDDKLRADQYATNFGYMLGVGYRFYSRCNTMFEFQQDMNRLVGQRFRALLTLSVAFGR
jgi:hypothetical protein